MDSKAIAGAMIFCLGAFSVVIAIAPEAVISCIGRIADALEKCNKDTGAK